jgi:hydrogenase/urease accessory protein HupE
MPEYGGGLGYVAGFTAATVLLHVAGITGSFVAAGTLGDRLGPAVARSIGGGAALLGSTLVLAGL